MDGNQGKTWLFDLTADPTEKNNLAASQLEKVAELQALLDQHHAGARAPLYPSTTRSPIALDKTGQDKASPEDEYVIWPN